MSRLRGGTGTNVAKDIDFCPWHETVWDLKQFLLLRNGRVCAGLSLALYLTWYYVGSPGECFLLSTVCVQAWLERAENAAKAKKEVDGYNGNEKKRKRTSIAAPEKRSLEAYFTVQPRWALSPIISNHINRKTFQAQFGENRRHRRKTWSEEKRGPRVVL